MSERSSMDREAPLEGANYVARMIRVSPLTIGAVYKKGETVGQGYVLNLSRGGVFLSTKELFEVGERIRIRFFLPFQIGQVDAEVAVRWRTEDLDEPPKHLQRGLGLEFLAIDREMQDKIGEFIDKFLELAEKLEDASG